MPATEPGGDDFGNFVTTALPALLRFGHVLTGNRQEAEDLVQEALARTMRRWQRGRPDEPLAYVRQVMVNTHLTRWRRWGSRVRLGEVPETAADDAALQRSNDRDALRRALAGLPPRQRTVLVLRYLEDLPDEAVAALMGCQPTTVRSQALRGLAALRRQVDAEPPVPAQHPGPVRPRPRSVRPPPSRRGVSFVDSEDTIEDRLRELLQDPAWSLTAWPDAHARVCATARRQRLRAARLAVGVSLMSAAAVVVAVIGLRPGLAAPPGRPAGIALPAIGSAGYPASIYPAARGPVTLALATPCPNPAGVQAPGPAVRATADAVVRNLGVSLRSDLAVSDRADWPQQVASWRAGEGGPPVASQVVYSGPLTSAAVPAGATGLDRAVVTSCGHRAARTSWLVITQQPGRGGPQTDYLLLDRHGHVLIWHAS